MSERVKRLAVISDFFRADWCFSPARLLKIDPALPSRSLFTDEQSFSCRLKLTQELTERLKRLVLPRQEILSCRTFYQEIIVRL